MKRIAIIILAVISTAAYLTGCAKPGDDTPSVISVTPASVDVSAEKATDAVVVDFSGEWTATSDQSWCKLLTTSGKGFGTVEFEVEANPENQIRSAVITVSDADAKASAVEVTVVQAASLFAVAVTELSFKHIEGKDSLQVYSLQKWTATTEQEWIHLKYESVAGKSSYLTVSVDANPATSPRSGSVKIESANGKATVNVLQDKLTSDTFIVTSTYEGYNQGTAKMSTDINGGTYTLSVIPPSSSMSWEASVAYESGVAEFVTLSDNFARNGNGDFKVSVPFNNIQTRVATIHVRGKYKDNTIDYPVELTQSFLEFKCEASVTAEGAGGDVDLGLSITPALALAYEFSESWLTVKDAAKGILTAESTPLTKMRQATVSISLERDKNVKLGEVTVQQYPQYSIVVPFQCNTYVTPLDPTSKTTPSFHASIIRNGGSTDMEAAKMNSKYSWRVSQLNIAPHQLSFYFRTEYTGELNFGFSGMIVSGEATLDVEIEGVKHRVTVSNTDAEKIIDCGKYTVSKIGYVRVNIIPISSTSAYLPYITSYSLGGSAINYVTKKNLNAITFVTEAETQASAPHWIRRGPSCHLQWTRPSGNTEYFYNEIVVPVGNDVPGAYFMTTGGDGFYMGIQPNTKGVNRTVLFSVWDTNTSAGLYAQLVRHGQGLAPNGFGHEGSGIQTFMYYDWEAGQKYATLVHVRPEVKNGVRTGHSLYTGYFWSAEKGWQLLAEVRKPNMTSYYTGPYSFSENFIPENGWITRQVTFTNQWMRTTDGVWHEVTRASVTADGTGSDGLRRDFYGGVTDDGYFYLRNIGYFDDKISPGTSFTRPASGKSAPVIDFDALNAMGVWDE